jgi:hypothetical protein
MCSRLPRLSPPPLPEGSLAPRRVVGFVRAHHSVLRMALFLESEWRRSVASPLLTSKTLTLCSFLTISAEVVLSVFPPEMITSVFCPSAPFLTFSSKLTSPTPTDPHSCLCLALAYVEGLEDGKLGPLPSGFGQVLRKSNGYFVDSSEVNDSIPFIFTVGDGTAIRGLDEGVRGMTAGAVRQILIPPSLAYVEGLEDGKPGPIPNGFGPRQQMRRVQGVRKDVPGEYVYLEVQLSRRSR